MCVCVCVCVCVCSCSWHTRSSNSSHIHILGNQLLLLGLYKLMLFTNHSHIRTLKLIIVKELGPTLMGHNWLQLLSLDWQEIFHMQNVSIASHSLHSVHEKYPHIFKEGH